MSTSDFTPACAAAYTAKLARTARIVREALARDGIALGDVIPDEKRLWEQCDCDQCSA